MHLIYHISKQPPPGYSPYKRRTSGCVLCPAGQPTGPRVVHHRNRDIVLVISGRKGPFLDGGGGGGGESEGPFLLAARGGGGTWRCLRGAKRARIMSRGQAIPGRGPGSNWTQDWCSAGLALTAGQTHRMTNIPRRSAGACAFMYI